MKRSKNQDGYMIIEASIVFPVIILAVCAMLLASVYIYEKAALQASVETALTYYKNSMTDSCIGTDVSKYTVDDSSTRTGSSLTEFKNLTIFDLFGKSADKNEIIDQINKIYGFRTFRSGDTSIDVKQGGILFDKYIEVRVQDKIHFPINLSFIGVDNSDITYDIRVRENVSDPDQFILDISVVQEFVMFYVNRTDIPNKINDLKEKFKPFYDRFLDPKSSTGKANVYDSAGKGGTPNAGDNSDDPIVVEASDVQVITNETTTASQTSQSVIVLDPNQYSVIDDEPPSTSQPLLNGPTETTVPESFSQTEAGYELATIAPPSRNSETETTLEEFIVEIVEHTEPHKANTDYIDVDFEEITE